MVHCLEDLVYFLHLTDSNPSIQYQNMYMTPDELRNIRNLLIALTIRIQISSLLSDWKRPITNIIGLSNLLKTLRLEQQHRGFSNPTGTNM